MISVRVSRAGQVRITYPRLARAVGAAAALGAGLALWVVQLEPEFWTEPLQYAMGLLLAAPGLWAGALCLKPRVVANVRGEVLVVRSGPAGFEATVARLPVNTLEVRVTAEPVMAVRYNSQAVSKRLLAGLISFSRVGLAKTEVKRHVLEVRNTGQAEWLRLFGSQVASEVENARLALEAAVANRKGEEADVTSG